MSEPEDVIDLTTQKKPREEKVKELTPLDRLRAKLEESTERPNKRVNVPARSGLSVEFSPNITQAEMRKWRKQAGEGTKNEFDLTKFSTIVVAQTCRGVWLNDEEILDENDYPVTFASPVIKEMLGVERPWPEGVRAMFGLDPHVEAAAMAILESAGYGESAEVVEDPLKDS